MGGKTIFTGTLIKVLESGPATQIQAIITNIIDASATKPYLIHLGPGVYDLGATKIVMKEWVSLQGSGQKATKITAAVITGFRATVEGINNTALTDLSIENTGGGSSSLAIFNNSASPRIERVGASATGGTSTNYGVYNQTSSPVMTNVTTSASGGSSNYGVFNSITASPVMTNVTAIGSGGTNLNFGVYNSSSSPIMTNVTASASGGTNSTGIFNASSSPVMMNITASASGGSGDNLGVKSANVSAPFIQDSIMEGVTKGLFITADSPGTRVVNSKIIGGVNDQPSGTTQCRGNYDASLALVDC
jgi:hypothetical protein